MSNLSKYRKSTVAVLTALLIIAIAAPLFSFAAAATAPTASFSPATGPNGTLIKVSGSGFTANLGVSDIHIKVDGHDLDINAYRTTIINSDYRLKTDSNGILTGYFVIYGLSVGTHTISVTDGSHTVIAGSFRITSPTVTMTPSSGAAGTSVLITASGFPTTNSLIEDATFTNKIESATFSGAIVTVPSVAGTTSTNDPTVLSSNVIAKDAFGSYLGTYTGTVSLGALTSVGAVWNMTDSWGNSGGATLSLTTPTVTLSPSSGPVGTVVTATLTGYGPATALSVFTLGNVAGHLTTITPTPSTVRTTEQGTAVFVFQIPAGDATSKSGAAGAQTFTVADLKGNVGTAAFTVTPKVTVEMGTVAAGSSGTSYVPASTVANMTIFASGFLPKTAISITALNGITPSEWTVPTAGWTVAKGTYDNGYLYTNDNGELVVTTLPDTSADFPTAKGQLPIRFSDGTNQVTANVNVASSGNIFVVSPSGATGQTGLTVTFFGTKPTALNMGATPLATSVLGSAQAWPTAVSGTFDVPIAASAGVKTISATGAAFDTVAFTVVTPAIAVVNPSSAAVGTTVTVVGTGFANTNLILSLEGASITVAPGAASILNGNTLIATFAVPNFLPGSYTLSVSDSQGGLPLNTVTKDFTVASASVQVTPTKGTLGSALRPVTIAITGSGFKAGDSITVKFDSTTITATTATGLTVINTNGGILLCSGFVIPTGVVAGTHTITVTGQSGAYATATFTVQPKLGTLAAVRPGAQVTVAGTGFAANSLQTLSINGTQTSWVITHTDGPATAVPAGTVIQTQSNGALYAASTVGFVVSSTQTSGALNVTVTDAAGNSASTILTILGTPTIVLGSSSLVAGTATTMGVSINGTGFTPSSIRVPVNTAPIAAALYSGSTFIANVELRTSTGVLQTTTSVGSDGAFPDMFSSKLYVVVPPGVSEGTYTLQVTIGTTGVSTPVETASTTVTVLGAPTIVAPATAAAGSNVTITVSGLTAITAADFGDVDLVTEVGSPVVIDTVAQFGGVKLDNSGSSAYTTTTWFIVPKTLYSGSYILTIYDSKTQLSAQAAITVTPSATLSPESGAKGNSVTVNGYGFASTSKITATFNGQAITLNAGAVVKSSSTGAFATTFSVPLTAGTTNTVTFTDELGNKASATFNVTNPTITITPTSGPLGTTVQIIGNDFAINSAIIIQIGGQVVVPTTADLKSNANGQFITYATVPNGLSGNITVTATDGNNNVGSAIFEISGTGPSTSVPSQTTLDSTAQTLKGSAATTTFSVNDLVKTTFVLQSTSGSRNVVVAVTFQQGARVFGYQSQTATMTTTPATIAMGALVSQGITGACTATIQIFDADGQTPLGVTILNFTVA